MARIEKVVCDVCGKEMVAGQSDSIEMLDNSILLKGGISGTVPDMIFYIEDVCSLKCFIAAASNNAIGDKSFWRMV